MRRLILLLTSSFHLFHHVWKNLKESNCNARILNSIKVIFIILCRLSNQFLALPDEFTGHKCINAVYWFQESSENSLDLILSIDQSLLTLNSSFQCKHHSSLVFDEALQNQPRLYLTLNTFDIRWIQLCLELFIALDILDSLFIAIGYRMFGVIRQECVLEEL